MKREFTRIMNERMKKQGLLNDEDENNCSFLLDVERINIDKVGRYLIKDEQGGSNNEVKYHSNNVIKLVDDDGNDEEDLAIIVDDDEI